jgi:pimeloyl-ACP methyl ester carboxylesterase
VHRIGLLAFALAVMITGLLTVGYRTAGVSVLHREAGGIPVSIYSTGSQPAGAVVIIHDHGSSRVLLRYWGFALALQGFDVYIPDLPGHGASRGRYSDRNAVHQVTVLSRAMAHDRIALVGRGRGGLIAARALAEMQPEEQARVRGMILLSPPAPLEPLPPNLLALAAPADEPAVHEAILRMSGGQTAVIQGRFEEGTAFQGAVMPEVAWPGLLFDSSVLRLAAGWIHASFATRAAGAPPDSLAAPVRAAGVEWVLLSLIGAVGAVFVIIPALSSRDDSTLRGRVSMRAPRLSVLSGLMVFALGALAAALVAVWVRPFGWLGLAGAEYLFGYFAYLSAVFLSLRLLWPDDYDWFGGPWADLSFVGHLRGLVIAGIALMLVGAVLHTSLLWFVPGSMRLVALLLLSICLWAFFVQEEAMKRALSADTGPYTAHVAVLIGRGLVVLIWYGASWLPNPPDPIFLRSVPVLAGLLVLLELCALSFDRNGYPIGAAALFKSVILAWFVAATAPAL